MMFLVGGSFYHQGGGSFDPPSAGGRSAKCAEYDVRPAGTWRALLLIMQTETWTDETLCEASYVAFIDAIEAEATEAGIPCETSVDDATLALWSL